MEEIWKDVVGYEGVYQVSNLGRVRCIVTRHMMKPTLMEKGYLRVCLTNKGHSHTVKVHRLVAKAFIPNIDEKPEINHINGIKTDNRVENLEWVTRKENMNHARKFGYCRVKKTHFKDKIMVKLNGEVYKFHSIFQASKCLKIPKAVISFVLNHNISEIGEWTFLAPPFSKK